MNKRSAFPLPLVCECGESSWFHFSCECSKCHKPMTPPPDHILTAMTANLAGVWPKLVEDARWLVAGYRGGMDLDELASDIDAIEKSLSLIERPDPTTGAPA